MGFESDCARDHRGRWVSEIRVSRRLLSDVWYAVARGRDLAGDLAGAEQARRNARLYRGKLMTSA